jgi:hypothetical protein
MLMLSLCRPGMHSVHISSHFCSCLLLFLPLFYFTKDWRRSLYAFIKFKECTQGQNGGKRWKVTEVGDSINQIILGWFLMGNTSYKFHFQDTICGNTGGQFAFVLIILEINVCVTLYFLIQDYLLRI